MTPLRISYVKVEYRSGIYLGISDGRVLRVWFRDAWTDAMVPARGVARIIREAPIEEARAEAARNDAFRDFPVPLA